MDTLSENTPMKRATPMISSCHMKRSPQHSLGLRTMVGGAVGMLCWRTSVGHYECKRCNLCMPDERALVWAIPCFGPRTTHASLSAGGQEYASVLLS